MAVPVERQAVLGGFIGRDRQRLRQRLRGFQRRHLGAVMLRPCSSYAAQRDALIGQALIGIVGPQGQPILGARREHPVRLGDAAGHKIVDHHPEIAVGAVEHDRVGSACAHGCVQARNNSLRRSFFIASGAVDLAGQEQTWQTLGLQGRIEFARIDMVIFDGIAWPDHANPLPGREWSRGWKAAPPREARWRCRWDRRWSRRGLPAREKSDARRDRQSERSCPRSRAITRPAALDLPGIHRRAMHIRPDYLMGGRRRAGDTALDLRRGDPLGHHRERLRRIVAGLHLDRGPIDRGAVEPRRRAGLQSPELEAGALERSRKPERRRLAYPARRPILLAEMDQPTQKRSGRDNHRTGCQLAAIGQADAGDPAVGDQELVGFALDDAEVDRLRDRRLHRLGDRACDRPGRAGPGPPDPCGD